MMTLTEFFRKALKQTVFILLLSGAIAVAVNMLRSDSLALFERTNPPASTAPAQPNESETEIPSISLEAAIKHFKQGTALFVDARLPADFAAGHIAGAVNVPESSFDEMIGPFLASTAPETLIITYCDGINCPLSKNLAEKLNLLGFENVYHLPDGWGKWQAHGMSVEKGE